MRVNTRNVIEIIVVGEIFNPVFNCPTGAILFENFPAIQSLKGGTETSQFAV